MDEDKNPDLTAAKQRIEELEALVASLSFKIQLLESQNSALVESLCKSGKVEKHSEEKLCQVSSWQNISGKLDHGADKQKPKETQATSFSPCVCVDDYFDKGMVTSEGADYVLVNGEGSTLEAAFTSSVLSEGKRMGLIKIQDDYVLAVSKQNSGKEAVMASSALKDCQTDLDSKRIQMRETNLSSESCSEIVSLPTMKTKKKKKGDISHHPRTHVALKVMYMGARFHGFASEASTQLTIESELFTALEKTKLVMGGRREAQYSRCGRTDKGVSANGQVVALLLRSCQKDVDPISISVSGTSSNGYSNSNTVEEDRVVAARVSCTQDACLATTPDIQEIDYVGVLNRALPFDIRVLGWCHVPHGFHARFSCLSREYKYFFTNDGLDIEAMRLACRKFEGEHDFRNFCKMDAANVHNYKRKIIAFDIIPCNYSWGGLELWMFRVKGTAFLWHQVRCMVAVLIMVGQRNETPLVVDELLDVHKTVRKPQYLMAPDSSLVLQSCEFEGLSFRCSPGSARLLRLHLEQQMREHLIAASILKEAFDQLPFSDGNELTGQGCTKKTLHVPLDRRPTEPTYEERRSKFAEKVSLS